MITQLIPFIILQTLVTNDFCFFKFVEFSCWIKSTFLDTMIGKHNQIAMLHKHNYFLLLEPKDFVVLSYERGLVTFNMTNAFGWNYHAQKHTK